jgi:hypothetical protein
MPQVQAADRERRQHRENDEVVAERQRQRTKDTNPLQENTGDPALDASRRKGARGHFQG